MSNASYSKDVDKNLIENNNVTDRKNTKHENNNNPEPSGGKIGTNDISTPWYLQTRFLMVVSVIERILFFLWGIYQDSNMEVRFTDIDYFVFTDASRFMNQGGSPYDRETYRYTPLLAWLLLPTSWLNFSFGKVLFAVGDLIAGYFILQILKTRGIAESRRVIYSTIWLLNPMVCTISTRGSSEGLLGAMVISIVWALYTKRYWLSGILTGLSVHFKIYPIIYVPTILLSLDNGPRTVFGQFFNKDRIIYALTSFISFTVLTGIMYSLYGYSFLHETYLHHLSRVDHRHNFSPYSTLLYMGSSPAISDSNNYWTPSKWAFVPQLGLSGLLIPLAFAKRDVIKTMFIQTVIFVTFNKVCTSQYFMWYMVLLPFYGPSAERIGKKKRPLAILAVALWIISQVLWIREGYLLEFIGESTFYPGLFLTTMIFFIVNCWVVGLFISGM